MAYINFIKTLKIGGDEIKGIVSGLSFSESDIQHNYINNEFDDNPIFDSPTQDPAVLSFQVADLTKEFMQSYFGATITGNTAVIPSSRQSQTKPVEITFNTGQVITFNGIITAKNVGEDLKTSTWKVELEVTVSGDLSINFNAGSTTNQVGNITNTSADANKVQFSIPASSTIFYTTDGSTPAAVESEGTYAAVGTSIKYTSGNQITVTAGSVVKAIAYRNGYLPSAMFVFTK